MKFKLVLLIVAALLTTVGAARAQEHESRPGKRSLPKSSPAKTSPARSLSVRLGEKVIVIPDPEGFEEGTTQFESFKQRVEVTEAPQNDVLAAHLSVSDCELVRKGLTPTYNHYTKVSVLKRARALDVAPGEMAAGVDDFRKYFGTYLDPNGPAMTEFNKHLEQGLSRLDAKETKVDFSKPQQLGEFNTRDNVHSFLMLMSFTINSGGTERTLPMLATTTFVRVKNRLIFVYSFMKYRSKADIDTIKQFTTKWTDSIVSANK